MDHSLTSVIAATASSLLAKSASFENCLIQFEMESDKTLGLLDSLAGITDESFKLSFVPKSEDILPLRSSASTTTSAAAATTTTTSSAVTSSSAVSPSLVSPPSSSLAKSAQKAQLDYRNLLQKYQSPTARDEELLEALQKLRQSKQFRQSKPTQRKARGISSTALSSVIIKPSKTS